MGSLSDSSDDERSQPSTLHDIFDIVKSSAVEQSFLIDDAVFYLSGDRSKKPVNLLHVLTPKSKATIVVEGVFVADADQSQYIKDPHRQRSQLKFPIIFGPVGQYSIGDDPVTLWIHYQGCWFEVRPTSPKYQRVSKEMANTVKLYYLGLDFYATFAEKFEKFRVPPASFNEPFEIIRQFCELYSGEGLHFSKVLKLLRESVQFFADMAAREDLTRKGYAFFDWVAAGSPTREYNGLQLPYGFATPAPVLDENTRAEIEPQPVYHDHQVQSPGVDSDAHRYAADGDGYEMDLDTDDPEADSRIGKPPENYRGDYSSPDYPNGITGQIFNVHNWVDFMLIILAHSCSYSECKASEVQLSNITTRIYREFSFQGPVNSRQLNYLFRKELRQALPAKYTAIHRQLAAGLQDLTKTYTQSKYHDELKEILAGRMVFEPRGKRAEKEALRRVSRVFGNGNGNQANVVAAVERLKVERGSTLNARKGVKRSGYGSLRREHAGL